jgi:hypothetical protein
MHVQPPERIFESGVLQTLTAASDDVHRLSWSTGCTDEPASAWARRMRSDRSANAFADSASRSSLPPWWHEEHVRRLVDRCEFDRLTVIVLGAVSELVDEAAEDCEFFCPIRVASPPADLAQDGRAR